MAIPHPIVPPPTIAIFSILRIDVSFPISGTLVASRSAKNKCRWANDSGDFISFSKHSCSNLTPSTKDFSVAALTAEIAIFGARKPLVLFNIFFENSSKISGEASNSSSLVFINGFPMISLANLVAETNKLLSQILSTTPTSKALRADIGFPEVIISSAAATPIRRGNLCVPPAPGIRPRFTSGRPTLAPSIIILY